MLIDLILDRKGCVPYSPKQFYDRCSEYFTTFPLLIGPVLDAMDEGEEKDVKHQLSNYVRRENDCYNHEIIEYIYSVDWL